MLIYPAQYGKLLRMTSERWTLRMSIDADLNKATLLPNADPLFQVQKKPEFAGKHRGCLWYLRGNEGWWKMGFDVIFLGDLRLIEWDLIGSMLDLCYS